MKLLRSLICTVLLGLTAFAHAAEPAIGGPVKGEVVEFGRFELNSLQQNGTHSATPEDGGRKAPGARFIEKTSRVPAATGMQFGFRYKISGVAEKGPATLKIVLIHPPIKNAKGEVERRQTGDQEVPVKDGVITEVTGYSLERPEELVPGIWTFEVWYRGQRLVTQTFTTY